MSARSKHKSSIVPGAFPISRAGSSSQSSSSLASTTACSDSGTPPPDSTVAHNNLLINDLAQGMAHVQLGVGKLVDMDEPGVTPKRNGRKGGIGGARKSLGRSPALADELGLLVDVNSTPTQEGGDTAKGKGKAKDLPQIPTTRLARNKNAASSLRAGPPPHDVIEISSDEDEAKNPPTFEVIKLRKEIADLRKQLAMQQQRAASKQKVAPVPADSELARVSKELADHKLRDKEFRESITNTLQCQICVDLLHQPYALSPCGHVCCLSCLQEWFKGSNNDDEYIPEDGDDDRPLHLRKTCPYCRARIRARPVQLFIIKSLVEAVDPKAHETATCATATPNGEDPWEGIFSADRGEDDEDELDGQYTDEDEDARFFIMCDACGESGIDDEGYCLWCGYNHGEESASESGEVDEEGEELSEDAEPDHLHHLHEDDEVQSSDSNDVWYDNDDDDGYYADDLDADASSEWVWPRPAPPCNPLDRQSNLHLNPVQFALCCRGVPFDMIAKYQMRYVPDAGIIARVDNANPTGVPGMGPNGPGEIWFGWNLLGVRDLDVDGSRYVRDCLRDMDVREHAWSTVGRGSGVGLGGSWTAWRLVRQGGPEDLDWGSDIDVRLPRA